MLYKFGRETRKRLGRFYFCFNLDFYEFGGFLMNQLFGYYTQIGAASRVGYLSSNIKHARVE